MTQAERKQKSINKIFDAAEKHLSSEGIENTDIDSICKKAGLTKGAFYHHFGSKQQFLLELLGKWITKLSAEVTSSPFDSYETTEIFNKIIDRMQPVFEKAGKQLPVFLELYIRAVSDESLKDYTTETYEDFIGFFSAVVSAGISKGSIKNNIDPQDAAKILFAITIGLLIQGLLKPEETDWSGLAKKSVSLLLGRR